MQSLRRERRQNLKKILRTGISVSWCVKHWRGAMITNHSNEFTIDLLSNASMEFFNETTMALFGKQLSQPIQLQGAWHMALTLLFFPSNNNKSTPEKLLFTIHGLKKTLRLIDQDNSEKFELVFTKAEKT